MPNPTSGLFSLIRMPRIRMPLIRRVTLAAACSLLLTSCVNSAGERQVVSNAATPVQMLEVQVGSHIDINLPLPPRHNWWAVESGDRPYLQSKTYRTRGLIRLWAMQPGKTEVVCALRNDTRVIRTVVVGVEVKP